MSDSTITFLILGVTVAVFVWDRFPVAAVALGVALSLWATGVFDLEQFGLTLGLVAAGMPDEAAFATAILYRVATFYVPPTWGFFAMRWLQRNSLL